MQSAASACNKNVMVSTPCATANLYADAWVALRVDTGSVNEYGVSELSQKVRLGATQHASKAIKRNAVANIPDDAAGAATHSGCLLLYLAMNSCADSNRDMSLLLVVSSTTLTPRLFRK